MTDHPGWPDQTIEDWLRMERYKRYRAVFDAKMDKDLQRVTDEQGKECKLSIIFGGGRGGGKTEQMRAESERAAALEKALEACRM